MKCFANEPYELEKFKKKNLKGYKYSYKKSLWSAIQGSFESFINYFLILCILWYGGHICMRNDHIKTEDIIKFIGHIKTLLDSSSSISNIY